MAITATLRTASTDAKVQKAAAASVASAPTAAPKPVAPKTATPKPVTRPAAPATAAAPATPPTPAPAAQPQRSTLRKPVTRPAAPTTKAAEAPVIDVQAEVVETPTPVADVKVESVNTVAAPAPGRRAVSVGAGSTASIGAEVAAPEPTPAPEPPAPTAEEIAQEQYTSGYNLCRSGAPELPADASEAAIEGWNQACAEITAELEAAAAPAPEPETQAVAHRPPSSLGHRINYSDGESFIGDWSSEDLKFPQLKIVQGSGPLSAMFNEGTVIYNEIELLPPAKLTEGAKNPVLRFIPVQIIKQYREKLSDEEQKAGAMPRIANSVAEVEEKGGVTTYGGSDTQPDNYWQASGKCLFLLELPEVEPGKDHPSFVLELDGKLYAVAIYYAAGNAWRNAGKQIFNVARTSLLVPKLDEAGQPLKDAQGRVVKKACAYKNFWSMGFVKKASGEFIVWQPTVKLLAKEPTGPELRAYCDSLISGGNDASVASETE